MPPVFQPARSCDNSGAMKNVGRGIVCGLLVATISSGCASSVANGALIGAGAGAAAGAGVGYALSSEDLLGSPTEDKAAGDISVDAGTSTLAAAAIGAMVGGIVGAMVGHQREEKYIRRKATPPPPPSAQVDPIIGKF